MTALIIFIVIIESKMSTYTNDTIIAQATPPGRGGVGILRISGPKVIEIARIVLGKLPQPRYADYLPFYDSNGKVLDQGLHSIFPHPTHLLVKMSLNCKDMVGR